MKVTDIIENEDGSATYTFDMTAEETEAMTRNGILWAIVCGVTGLTVDKVLKDYPSPVWNKYTQEFDNEWEKDSED